MRVVECLCLLERERLTRECMTIHIIAVVEKQSSPAT